MNNKMTGAAIVALGLAVGSACGDDVSQKSSNTNQHQGTSTNGAGTSSPSPQENTGDPATTRFEVEIADGNDKTPLQGSVENEAASKESSGAAIAGSAIEIYLVSGQTLITATVETTEDNLAPGSFSISPPPAGSYVTFLDPVNGSILDSVDGTINIDSCPKRVGDKVVGRFAGVTLKSDIGNATKTLDGTFDLQVFAKAGDLFCRPPETTDPVRETQEDPGNTASGGTCAWDQCLNDGLCCPYRSCMTRCEESCIFDPTCLQDPLACAQCANACLDSCGVSSDCRQALGNLTSCDAQYGCSDREGQEEACMLDKCCNELQVAF